MVVVVVGVVVLRFGGAVQCVCVIMSRGKSLNVDGLRAVMWVCRGAALRTTTTTVLASGPRTHRGMARSRSTTPSRPLGASRRSLTPRMSVLQNPPPQRPRPRSPVVAPAQVHSVTLSVSCFLVSVFCEVVYHTLVLSSSGLRAI